MDVVNSNRQTKVKALLKSKIEAVATECLFEPCDVLESELESLLDELTDKGILTYWHFLTNIAPGDTEILIEAEFEDGKTSRLIEIKLILPEIGYNHEIID